MTSWTRGWTQFVPFESGNEQYLLLYKGGTGEVEIDKVTGNADGAQITETWSSTWTRGWTNLVPLDDNGALLGYKAATGEAAFMQMEPEGVLKLATPRGRAAGRRSRRSRSTATSTSSSTRPAPGASKRSGSTTTATASPRSGPARGRRAGHRPPLILRRSRARPRPGCQGRAHAQRCCILGSCVGSAYIGGQP